MHSILNFTNTTIAGLLAQAPNATYTNDSTIRASPSSYRPLDELILGVADQRQLMRDMLKDLNHTETTHKLAALRVLHVLVEDLDNVGQQGSELGPFAFRHALLTSRLRPWFEQAEDLQRISGYQPIVELLPSRSNGFRATRLERLAECRVQESAAYVIGNAAKNQRALQLHMVLDVGALGRLTSVLLERNASRYAEHPLHDAETKEACDAAATKAMYALSAIVRNNPDGQRACDQASCYDALLSAMDASAPRLARKALVLLADLIHESLAAAAAEASGRPTYDSFAHAVRPARPFWRGETTDAAARLCGAVLALIGPATADVDTREKAVWALRHLHAAGLLGEPWSVQAALAALHDAQQAACGEEEEEESQGGQEGEDAAEWATSPSTSCIELRRLARGAIEQIRSQQEAPAGRAPIVGRIRADETVFHWEI